MRCETRRRPAEPHAHLEMALVLEALGETDRAREHLGSALTAWEPADETFQPACTARTKLAELDGES